MSSGSIGNLLDKIPGYGGYRDRERRRESDRLIREALARDYRALADRLSRLAKRMAEERNIRSIRYVDQPQQRLVHFIDRVTTASYGYAGLFSDRPVDERALDQIAEFDRSLDAHLAPLDQQIRALEQTDPESQEFKDQASAVGDSIEQLLDRFERRSEIIASGNPKPEAQVSALLALPTDQPKAPNAYNLHDGEAVSYAKSDYVVKGRITVTTTAGNWRCFQLDGGDDSYWLQIPAVDTGEFLWLQQFQLDGKPGDTTLNVELTAYKLASTSRGTGEIVGQSGKSDSRDTTIYRYASDEDDNVINVYDWGTDSLAFRGRKIDPLEIEIWSREGGSSV